LFYDKYYKIGRRRGISTGSSGRHEGEAETLQTSAGGRAEGKKSVFNALLLPLSREIKEKMSVVQKMDHSTQTVTHKPGGGGGSSFF